MRLCAFLVVLAIAAFYTQAENKFPLVVLPSSLRWNSTNTITVTPLIIKNNREVDAEFRVEDGRGNIYMRENLIWKAGVANNKHFYLTAPTAALSALPSELKVKLILSAGHSAFETLVKTSTDLRVVHVFSDKQHYKNGENVLIRALPLDFHNELYTKPIEFVLINPGRFELLRRRAVSKNGRFVAARLPLPQHLQYGEWRVEARAVDSKDALGTVYFNVHDYILPNFEVSMVIDQERNDVQHVNVTVRAKYSHTVLVKGSLFILCVETQDNVQNRSKPIFSLDSEFNQGIWSGTVNVSGCIPTALDPAQPQTKPITLLAAVREEGGGNVGEATAIYDPTEPRFDLIPLKPGFGEKATKISILAVSSEGATGATLSVNATCLLATGVRALGESRQITRVGETIEIVTPSAWKDARKGASTCVVVAIQAARRLADGTASRQKTLLLPVISANKNMDLSWIEPIKGVYKAGDTITTRVDTKDRYAANYIVHCNGQKQVAVGTLSGPVAPLTIAVTPEMKGTCLLAVYTTHGRIQADVLLFIVEDQCKYTIEPIGGATSPGAEIDVQLDSGRAGIALISAIDDRLNWISDKPRTWTDLLPSKFWSHQSPTDSFNNTANLINFAEVDRDIIDKCSKAGDAYAATFKSCPEKRATSSVFSDTCLRNMWGPCNRAAARGPILAPSCQQGKDCSRIQTISPPTLKGMVFPFMLKVLQTPVNDVPLLQEKGVFHSRKNLPHVWIFEDYEIPTKGRLRLNYRLPDAIGRWSLVSSFWSKGDHDLCLAPEAFVHVRKEFFVEAKVPASAYLNESVAVQITVSGDYIERATSLVVCQSMDRSVCSDVGINGEKGEAVFSRVELSTDIKIVTKVIAMKFLATGVHNVTFTLRKEEFYPGRYHCDGGDVFDSVQHTVRVHKRAELEEHYRGLILTVDKPVIDTSVFDVFVAKKPTTDIIQVREYRESSRPSTLFTEITTPLKATDHVHVFTLEISKFLPLPQVEYTDAEDVGGRRKRSAQQLSSYSSSFLSDVLQQLALHTFKQEQLRAVSTTPVGALEALDNSISSEISDMLRFSDCGDHAHEYCGFANEGKPPTNNSYSVFLTAMSTSLLCKASADPQFVCGALGFLHSRIGISDANVLRLDKELDDALQFNTNTDRLYFSTYMTAQAAEDCRMYACLASGTTKHSWEKLYQSFYKFDDRQDLDGRTVAALATFSTPATRKRMRAQLSLDIQSGDIAPFWSARSPNSVDGSVQKAVGRAKPGDVLINSLALIAFADHQREVPMNFDLLADWIDEQRDVDELYGNVVDTFFASRAISTYRMTRGLNTGVDEDSNLQVEIQCAGCPQMVVNVTESAPLFYIPTTVRNLTILTTGRGKARAGVRILAAKKQRQRRGNVNAVAYPVEVSMEQTKLKGDGRAILQQKVCLRPMTPLIRYVEVSHGIYTGFTMLPHHFAIIEGNSTNETYVKPTLESTPFISTFAVHLVLSGLEKDKWSCYKIGIMEPKFSHEPGQLAPVAVTVRHATKGIIGENIVLHPDATALRSKRSVNLIMPDLQQVVVYDYVPKKGKTSAGTVSSPFVSFVRRKRDIPSEAVETVCFPGGQCTCAERSCNVNCDECEPEEAQFLRQDVCDYGAFAATVEITSIDKMNVGGQEYMLLQLQVLHWSSKELGKPTALTAWLRPCNRRCTHYIAADGSTYIFVGESAAVLPDESGRLNYLLRDWDRFIKADETCSSVLTALVINKC